MSDRSSTWRIQLDVGIHVEPYVGSITLTEENFSNSQVDEVVIDHWFHLEAMADDGWYLRIGDKRYNILVLNGAVRMQDSDYELPPIVTVSDEDINRNIDTVRLATQTYMRLVDATDADDWQTWLKIHSPAAHKRLINWYWLRGDSVDPDEDED